MYRLSCIFYYYFLKKFLPQVVKIPGVKNKKIKASYVATCRSHYYYYLCVWTWRINVFINRCRLGTKVFLFRPRDTHHGVRHTVALFCWFSSGTHNASMSAGRRPCMHILRVACTWKNSHVQLPVLLTLSSLWSILFAAPDRRQRFISAFYWPLLRGRTVRMACYDSPYSYTVRRLSSADTIKQMLFDIPDCSQSLIFPWPKSPCVGELVYSDFICKYSLALKWIPPRWRRKDMSSGDCQCCHNDAHTDDLQSTALAFSCLQFCCIVNICKLDPDLFFLGGGYSCGFIPLKCLK